MNGGRETMIHGDGGRILVVDDEKNMRHMLSKLLEKNGFRVDTAEDGLDALERIRKSNYDFILCDVKMPAMDGMSFLESSRKQQLSTPVIMMSAYGTIDSAVEAMKQGAYDYISKPFRPDEILLTLKKAEEREGLKKENLRLKEKIRYLQQPSGFGKIIGTSTVIRDVILMAEKSARFDTTVLITGESGTGKELVARGIHENSSRSAKPMIAINCGGIPENLLESELFGHVRGAFTGADKDKKGLFAEADGSTIFLDEVGELPYSLQVKLLRVLQESELRAVGDSRTRRIDIRIIAATARDLEEDVGKEKFRQDLFYRLNVFRIHMPPLREWADDIPILCHHFITMYNEKFGKHVSCIHPEAMQHLAAFPWPGNVRELENTIQRAMVLAEGDIIRAEDLPSQIKNGRLDSIKILQMEELSEDFSLKAARRIVEKKMIIKALKATDGNRTKASRLLEISHPSLLSKIKDYGIDL